MRAKGIERHLRWCEMAEALRITTPSMPWYSEEYGWACRKCFESGLERYLFHVLYTPEEFEERWEECKNAEEVLAPPYPFA